MYAVDFEQPRALWQKVFSDTDRAHFVGNVAGHLKNAKSAEVKARQRMFPHLFVHALQMLTSPLQLAVSVFAAVDQSLSDRIADAIGAPHVKPLATKSAQEAIRFKYAATSL